MVEGDSNDTAKTSSQGGENRSNASPSISAPLSNIYGASPSAGAGAPSLPPRSKFANIFLGAGGIRAGWRFAIFIAVVAAVSAAANFTLHHIPAFTAWEKAQPQGVLSTGQVIFNGLISAFLIIVSVRIMAAIERKHFADYGLPLAQTLGKRFWQGALLGFAMLAILMGGIAAFHGFSVSGFALGGAEALKYGAIYGGAIALSCFFEEFSFRGYMQAMLGSGMGFWPAAIVLAILFGAIHLGNSGEAIFGATMAGCFGLVAAFSLRRTGNIWLAIGMHTSWDWGETFFFSVPDSGTVAQGHLMNSSFHGARWLTGGTVGPEGSLLAIGALVLWAVAIHFLFPAKRAAM
jgi:CAAX protease family protein